MTVKLRDYQSALREQVREALKNHKRVCAYGPTGSGKTEVGMALVDDLLADGKRVTWCVNRIDLIEQTSKRFDDHGLDHGVVQAKHHRTSYVKACQIASIQTINRRKIVPGLDVIIIDEAHGAISPTYRKFLDAHDVPVIGLTATPFSKGLGTIFGELVHSTTIKELTDEGWLVPARYFAPDRPDLSGVRITAGDYNEADLAVRVNTARLVGNIVDEWKKRAEGMKTVVFATTIEHSKNIVEQFKLHGVAAEHIDAYTKPDERKDIIDRLRSGETRVISNVSVLAEGFDCPDMECMILARPTRSLIRYLQMVGRVLRPAPGKKEALVLDHSSTVERLGFADEERELSLDDGKSRISKHEAKQADTPHECPKCHYMMRKKAYPCPHCLYKPELKQVQMDVAEGTLKELRGRHLTIEERQVIYSAFVGYAMKRGQPINAAKHRYREFMRTWPNGLKDDPGPMIPAVQSFITACNIRFAHSKHRRSA